MNCCFSAVDLLTVYPIQRGYRTFTGSSGKRQRGGLLLNLPFSLNTFIFASVSIPADLRLRSVAVDNIDLDRDDTTDC